VKEGKEVEEMAVTVLKEVLAAVAAAPEEEGSRVYCLVVSGKRL
jgi:hypothetical protein